MIRLVSVRFTGFRAPDGLLVLDGESGEVVFVPDDGGPPIVRRAAAGLVLAKPAVAAPTEAAPSELEREVLATYPLPIARAFARYLKEPDPRQKCKLLVDTFATVLKLWALQIASEYLRADGLYDPHVQELLTRDLQRPLISAWASMVHRGLVALRGDGRSLFAPELGDAFDRLELHCKQPIAVRVRYEDEEGSPKYKQSKLGRIQALIRYRNSLAHGFDQSLDKAREDLAMYGPVLTDLLERARFMSRRPLVYLRATRDREGAEGFRLMGLHARTEPERFIGLALPERGGPVHLLDEGSRELLPLHHFVDVSHREDRSLDVLLFDGSTRSTVVYVSADGEHVEKQVRPREIRELVGQKEQRDEVTTTRDVTLESLGVASTRSATRVLSALERTGRFLPDAAIPRHAVEAQLQFFFERDYRAFVVTGEGGTGKTTLLCRVAQERMRAGDVVVMVPAFSLADSDPVRRLTSDLGLRIPYFEELLAALDPIFRREPTRRLVLIVDALNEHRDPAALVRAIDNAVAQAADYPWFRIVASIRASVYERLPPDARFGRAPGASYFLAEDTRGTERRRTPLVPLGAFDDDEVLAAYSAYRALRWKDPDDPIAEPAARFRPLSAIEELDADGSTRRLLRHPLLMRLVLAAHNRRPLPANLAPDRAVELFWDEVVVERGAERGHPERGVFLKALVREMDRASVDSIARDRLYANELLKPALLNPQHDSPFVQLLDLGILTEDWSGDDCRVRFAHADMFELMLAELHEAHVETGADLRRLLERSTELRSLRAAALLLLRRGAEAGALHLLTDALEGEPRSMVAELVRDVVVELARLGSPAFEPTVRELARASDVLVAVFDALFLMGASARAEHVLSTLEGLRIDDARVQLGLAFRRGRAEHRRGDARKAAETLERATELARSCEAELDACRIDALRAMLAFERNDLELASSLCASVESTLMTSGAFSELSEVRRVQGLVADRRGDREAARAIVTEAIELAKKVDDRVNMAKAHNNVAAFFAMANVYEEAEHHFLEARALHEAAGARVSAAIADHNLAGIYFHAMHDLDRSRLAYQRAQRTFAAAKHARGEAAGLTSLAAVELVAGRPAEAIPLLDRALVLWEGASDTANTAYARYLRAMAAIDAALPIAQIESEITKHRELASELDTPHARLHAAVLALRASIRADRSALPDVEALEVRLAAMRSEHQVEDGVAFALVDAAVRARDLGRGGLAWQWAERALSLAGAAPFPLRRTAESIVVGAEGGATIKPS